MGNKDVTRLGFGILFFVFFMNASNMLWAQDETCVLPTGPGQALNDLGSSVEIVASSYEISPSAPVTLYVNSNGWGHPDYTWDPPDGTGYTLSASVTDGDFVPITLSVIDGVCGANYDPYVTVTVRDTLGAEDSIVIKNTAAGWKEIGRKGATCSGLCSWPTCTNPSISGWHDEVEVTRWWHNGTGFCYAGACSYDSPSGSPVDPPCGGPQECAVSHGNWCNGYEWCAGCLPATQGYIYYVWGCP